MSRVAFLGLMGLAWAQNVGIGTSNPQYRLDVVGRARVQQLGTQTAGIWFYQTTPNADRAFVGMANDDYVGFWGNAGANWGMVMNVANGNVGIGTMTPNARLSLGASLANTKLALYENAAGADQYGFGIQPSQFRIHLGNSGARFSFLNAPNGTELVTILGSGNVGIGITNPDFRLDVGDRMRVRQGSSPSAGIWFFQNPPAGDRAFVGMANNDYVGFWGNAGAAWHLVMNVADGRVGIGTLQPSSHVTISRPNEAAAYQLELRNEGGITTGNFDGIRFTQGPTGGTPLGGIRLLYKNNGFTDMGFYLRALGDPTQELPRVIFTDSGAIRFVYGVQTASSAEPATLMMFNYNERHWGGGADDGFRMRFHGGVGGFSNNTDLWIFEKTDGNDPYPDGAIVFRMYGTAGAFNALNIIGDWTMGSVVGINTGNNIPTAPFEVRKPLGGGLGNGQNSDVPTVAIIRDFNNSRMYDWPNGWGGGLSTWDIACSGIRYSGLSQRSDRKYKRDIKSLSPAELLPRFMALRPVSYYYRSDIKVCDDPERMRFGFIANEVEELFPNLVDNAGLPDSIARGLEYDGFIPILVSVVQAQQRELEALRRQVAEWAARYEALEKRWNELAGEVKRLRRRKEGDIVGARLFWGRPPPPAAPAPFLLKFPLFYL